MVRKGRSGPNETFACSDARGGCFRFEQTQGEYCAGLGDAPTSRHRASQSRLIVHAIDYFFEAYQQNLKIDMRSNFRQFLPCSPARLDCILPFSWGQPCACLLTGTPVLLFSVILQRKSFISVIIIGVT